MTIKWNTVANVAMTCACVVFIVSSGLQLMDRNSAAGRLPPSSALGAEPVNGLMTSVSGVATKGDQKAQIAIVEFSDFECPYCGRHARDTYQELQREFVDTGKIQYAFRHLPLGNHPFAQKAAEAAECAGEQGQFWTMHDRLFLDQKALAESHLVEHAIEIGVELNRFRSCLGGVAAPRVARDVDEARRLGITSTPTFLVGTIDRDGSVHLSRRIRGAQPLQVFRDTLDALVNGNKGG